MKILNCEGKNYKNQQNQKLQNISHFIITVGFNTGFVNLVNNTEEITSLYRDEIL